MVGTWHCESISDTQRYFEQLTFNADGTLTGMRKWQFRKLVKIDGEQRYTDWESEDILEGTFSGTWKLKYYSPEGMTGEKRNCLLLNAPYDDTNSHLMAYSNIATFDFLKSDECERVKGQLSYIVQDMKEEHQKSQNRGYHM